MVDIYQEIVRIKEKGGEAALVTIVSASGSTPREEGTKMLVKPDGSIIGTVGGGGLEAQVIEEAVKVIKQAKPRRFHMSLTAKEAEESGMICGGELDVFIEPILTAPTMYIFGGGHISLPLAQMGKMLGFDVAVIDDRAEFANAERFPEAETVIAADFNESFAQLKIDKSSYIVIVTRGHQHDELVLEWAITTPAKYIGMIGSKTKVQTTYDHLLAKGVPQKTLDAVFSPIGLAIGAQAPEEIAVSIMAEIIKVRRT
ncbi:MAG: XdhC/CoxI family protein [Dehalococcoidia bacterium]|jgi:xanthine dehydrogenase accessory factor